MRHLPPPATMPRLSSRFRPFALSLLLAAVMPLALPLAGCAGNKKAEVQPTRRPSGPSISFRPTLTP